MLSAHQHTDHRHPHYDDFSAIGFYRAFTLYRYSNSACLSIHPSVHDVPVLDENGLTYRHSFFSPYGRLIILVLSASNVFTNSNGVTPCRGASTGGV